VLFTDGLIEGYDGRAPGRRLGDEGMRQVLGRLVLDGMSGKELADALLAEVQERNGGDLTDDVALLLLRW
jgi:serine phosphatase RsbU (regulator of sigma subunit)